MVGTDHRDVVTSFISHEHLYCVSRQSLLPCHYSNCVSNHITILDYIPLGLDLFHMNIQFFKPILSTFKYSFFCGEANYYFLDDPLWSVLTIGMLPCLSSHMNFHIQFFLIFLD